MSAGYAIGIGLNLFDARAILVSQERRVVVSVTKPRHEISANETLRVLLELFEEIISKSKRYQKDIKGVGVALGGIVDNKKGIVHWPQKHDSSYVYISLPLKEYLEKKFGLPVILENDANACAFSEHSLNFSQYQDVLYMFSGVGCGLIVAGELYRGKDGAAGELFINSTKKASSLLGDFAFLKQWPADLGIVKRAKELVSLGRETSLIRRITSTGELSLEVVFEEAKKKDRVAREVLREAALSLGAKISFLINLLNPEVVIIGGGLEQAGEFFLEACSDAVKMLVFSEMRRNLKLTLSNLGKEATSLGAALIIFKEKPLH